MKNIWWNCPWANSRTFSSHGTLQKKVLFQKKFLEFDQNSFFTKSTKSKSVSLCFLPVWHQGVNKACFVIKIVSFHYEYWKSSTHDQLCKLYWIFWPLGQFDFITFGPIFSFFFVIKHFLGTSWGSHNASNWLYVSSTYPITWSVSNRVVSRQCIQAMRDWWKYRADEFALFGHNQKTNVMPKWSSG